MSSEAVNRDFSDITTPVELVEAHPDLFTQGQITWLLRNRDRNGLREAGAVIQVGRKIYISKNKFVDWFMKQYG